MLSVKWLGQKWGFCGGLKLASIAEQICRTRVARRAVGCLPQAWGTMVLLMADCDCYCCIPNVIDGAIHEELIPKPFC